ncbi:hypothetical protein OJ997_25235 [Solirubrobacter phytolaccae]|uniref:Acyl-CoA dehydrogenase n=1 Tax=Solirubrobacter phytolaccae TaxID=1404360 RepID=A0A9X3NC04_9ACTN|nr:hypothetical protein [Solirubrobacter phytolaccae]MDA0183638.1 hypothetical protein [Solirubrobacter phytolaccae]
MRALDEIAANAAELDANPAFPTVAIAALTQLEVPATRGEEWALVRRVARADGSVGRIFEGHLNAQERLKLDGIDPGDHWLGVWGADPAPNEGEPASVHNDTLNGTKVFCSGAGGLTRALVIAKGTLVYVDLTDGNVEVDKGWYRAGGMRASESHRVHFHGAPILATLTPLTTEPYLSGDAIRTAAAWAGMVDCGVDSALQQLKDDDLRAHAAGKLIVAQQTIDRWFEYAARAEDLTKVSIPLRAAVADAGATVFGEAARATGSRPFATGTALDRARRDFELFVLQHRLDPFLARLGRERIS